MSVETNSTRTGNKNLRIIFLTIFMDLVGFSIIFPLFPAMLDYYLTREGPDSIVGYLVSVMKDLSISGSGDTKFLTTVLFGGILGSLYSTLQFIFSPILGQLSDRYGRRPILIFTIAGTTLGYLLWVFADSFTLLLLSRIIGGVMGGNLAVATAAVADITSEENRSKGMALVGVAFGVGFIIGPAIGGLSSLIDLTAIYPRLLATGINPFSIPALFAFVLALFNLFWVIAKLPETLPQAYKNPSVKTGQSSRRLSALFSVNNGSVRLVSFIYFIFIIAFSGLEFTITFLALERLNYSPADNTKLFLFIGFILIAVQGGLIRQIIPVIGEKSLTICGMLFGIFAFVCLAHSPHWQLFYFGLGLLGLSVGFTTPTLTSLASLYSTKSDQGRDIGSFRSSGSLARALGPLFFAFLYWYLGSKTTYLTGAVLLIFPIFMGTQLKQPEKKTEL